MTRYILDGLLITVAILALAVGPAAFLISYYEPALFASAVETARGMMQ